jgi:hypothetical protein
MYLTGLPSIALEPFVMSMYPTEQPYLALEPSVMSLYPTGHPNVAKDPLVMPHYMSVLLMIRPKKPVMAPVSLVVPHDVPDPLRDVPVPFHDPHIIDGFLREVHVLLCSPDGVPEHLKDVNLQFLDLNKTGKNGHVGSFFNELIIHDLIIKNGKKISIQNSHPSFFICHL